MTEQTEVMLYTTGIMFDEGIDIRQLVQDRQFDANLRQYIRKTASNAGIDTAEGALVFLAKSVESGYVFVGGTIFPDSDTELHPYSMGLFPECDQGEHIVQQIEKHGFPVIVNRDLTRIIERICPDVRVYNNVLTATDVVMVYEGNAIPVNIARLPSNVAFPDHPKLEDHVVYVK